MNFILAIQAILSILISLAILLQHRTSGLSTGMGGMGVVHVQRRGAEKVLYQGTVVMGILFILLTILDWYV
jgi:protein translocase SecG subunit